MSGAVGREYVNGKIEDTVMQVLCFLEFGDVFLGGFK